MATTRDRALDRPRAPEPSDRRPPGAAGPVHGSDSPGPGRRAARHSACDPAPRPSECCAAERPEHCNVASSFNVFAGGLQDSVQVTVIIRRIRPARRSVPRSATRVT
eukprot:767945-Hanusia_phi.AAC.17